MSKKIKAGIIGAGGYTGLELIKLIYAHPYFELSYIANSSGSVELDDLHPSLNSLLEKEVQKASAKKVCEECEIIFLALPHKSAMEYVKPALKAGKKVVDLSADYRLKKQTYEQHYTKHTDEENIEKSTYGLIEYFRDEIAGSSLVASPGCYPTATLLGLLPFVEHIDTDSIVFVDAKSGVSGAGKRVTQTNSFVSINENIHAYSPLCHRHEPEIKEKVEGLCKKSLEIAFVPHLIPATRGELVSIYAKLKDEVDASELLSRRYKDERFVRLFDTPVDIKSASGTHFCDIYAVSKGKKLFVSSAIDNLLRGASSQALCAANIMFGIDEGIGMPILPYTP